MAQEGLRADAPPPEQYSIDGSGKSADESAASIQEQREAAWLAALERNLRRRSTADLRNRAEILLGRFEKVR